MHNGTMCTATRRLRFGKFRAIKNVKANPGEMQFYRVTMS